MGWWLSYGVTRAVGDLVKGALQGPSRTDGGNYLLPDEKARQAACAQLAMTPGLDADKIEVSVLSGVLRLTGSVPSAGLKTRAGELCEAIGGVARVQNELAIG